MPETQLVEWNGIKTAISKLITTDVALIDKEIAIEMGKVDHSLEAVKNWAKDSKQSLGAQNEIAEYRLRLNRKQGEWINENIPEEGTRCLGDLIESPKITLAQVGIDRNDSPKYRILARIPSEKLEIYIIEVKEKQEEIHLAGACTLWKKPHVSFNSGENEWYTPIIYIEAARNVMGGVDTDPASSDIANKTIKANKYFTIENDGRLNQWTGNVWMNPPYSQPLVTEFCNLLASKFETGEFQQACVLVNNATETSFYQNMLTKCSAVCFIKGRVKFVDKDGNESGAPLQGQTILYFGPNREKFVKYFGAFGVILYA